ncbi:hypothetical protein TYRP_015821 [Tyrophagus putrescentiae]|nr:hypothetical protein TYRP_015821 [Tyrophagus putrescentiae]
MGQRALVVLSLKIANALHDFLFNVCYLSTEYFTIPAEEACSKGGKRLKVAHEAVQAEVQRELHLPVLAQLIDDRHHLFDVVLVGDQVVLERGDERQRVDGKFKGSRCTR